MKKILITGTTGMVGNIVLQHALQSEKVKQVISISRKSSGLKHPKLIEIIHKDFCNYSSIADCFEFVDVAYFCLGAYTGAVTDKQFKKITVEFTTAFADKLKAESPKATFCFLSGTGADRKEKSRIAFARYKGIAENYLLSKRFNRLYIFRPSYIYPVTQRKEPNIGYQLTRWLYPFIKLLGKQLSIKSIELGKAIFEVGLHGADKETLENRDILKIAQK